MTFMRQIISISSGIIWVLFRRKVLTICVSKYAAHATKLQAPCICTTNITAFGLNRLNSLGGRERTVGNLSYSRRLLSQCILARQMIVILSS